MSRTIAGSSKCSRLSLSLVPLPSMPVALLCLPHRAWHAGLKPELPKPTSWGLLVVRERLERLKFQVAFLATTHSSFGGRMLFI